MRTAALRTAVLRTAVLRTAVIALSGILTFGYALGAGADTATPTAQGLKVEQLAKLRQVRQVALSPDGKLAAFALGVPRTPGQGEDGSAWRELHLLNTADGSSRPFITGEVNIKQISFSPDGQHVLYVAKRFDDEEDALWAIPVDGGESRRLLQLAEGIQSYSVSPDGQWAVARSKQAEAKERKAAKDQGYDQEVFEEDHRPSQAHVARIAGGDAGEDSEAKPRMLALEGTTDAALWSPAGNRLLISTHPRNLIDDRYMLRRVHVVDCDSGAVLGTFETEGKLGAFDWSPDGAHVAMIAAADLNDPREGRLVVGTAAGGALRDLLPGLKGHVSGFVWRDATTLVAAIDEGSQRTIATVGLDGQRRDLMTSGDGQPVAQDLAVAGDLIVFRGDSSKHPAEVFVLQSGKARRLTDSNPWLAEVALAHQEVIRWKASDGLELEGILIHPLNGAKPAPLLLMVHGGPESHDRDGWVTAYNRPGQLAAARGYAVLYPNYRGSTGRGLEFSKLSQGDAAGKEFQDLVEAVDHLVAEGIADNDRVGITGGSYGGYATAWCSTYYTERFRAGVMFVGISNKVSKGFTTDIPNEDRRVHTLFEPWHKWQFSLERSPLFYAEKSRTPLLIAGGTDDTRVHPSQSLQLYRALKLLDNAPVRYVRYPGEKHGNSRAASRDDYVRRILQWMDHFVMEGRSDLPSVDPERAPAAE